MARILVLVGPTGVGKTELSLRLAEHFGCPIINADSRQIYRELPIGTAAPTAADCARVRHYMVGTHAVEETYNAGRFARDAWRIIRSLPEPDRTDVPVAIVSGGAMLYIDALLYGLDELPPVDAAIREQTRRDYEQQGLAWLQAEVERLDPAYYDRVDRANPQRLLRCLEICRAAGQPYSSFCSGGLSPMAPEDYVIVGLNRDREQLYERINLRVQQMLDAGLEQEARAVYGRLATPTVGYAEWFRYFDGEISCDEAIRLIRQNSRHYAKRQLTWWRRNTNIHWLNADEDEKTLLHTITALLAAPGMHAQQ